MKRILFYNPMELIGGAEFSLLEVLVAVVVLLMVIGIATCAYAMFIRQYWNEFTIQA